MATATLDNVQREKIGAAYTQALPTIVKICEKFSHRFGGHVDDHVADAGTVFIAAYADHIADPSVDWNLNLRQWVWYGLLDRRRTEISRESKRRGMPLAPAADPDTLGPGWLDELSTDAKLIVDLVVGGGVVAKDAMAKGGQPRNWRSTVRAYLTRTGWAAGRIKAAFEEIGHVLCN